MCQETPFKNLADVELSGAHKISLEQGKKTKLGKSKNSLIAQKDSEIGVLYDLNGMLLFINGDVTNLKPDHLEDIDKEFKEMNEWGPNEPDHSKIETFGNYRVLVIDFEFADRGTGRYSFWAQTKNNKKILVGFLEYELTNKSKAKEAIDKLIKHIKFK